MRITALGMVKNEADIVHLFAGHLAALCDAMVLVDNVSSDGTSEFLRDTERADPRFQIHRYAEPGYEQSLLMSTLAHQAPAAVEADWLLVLDADEFVDVADREQLEDRLSEHADTPFVTLQWKNVVPVGFDDLAFDRDRKVWVPETTARHCAIAVNRALLRDDTSFAIAQGNHTLLNRPLGHPLPSGVGPDAFHVPIRSRGQIVCKALQGVLAYAANAGVRDPRHGSHWHGLLDAHRAGELTDARLNGEAARYGMARNAPPVLETAELVDGGYTQTTLDVAFDDSLLPPPPAFDPGAVAMELAAASIDMADHRPIPLRKLQLDGREITRAPDDRGVRYGPLADRPAPEPLDAERLVTSFVEPHAWPIRTVVPSAWGGHIPFLFCLFNAVRPRRFVELGSHHGASFLAACQAVARLDLDTECIAIDSWEGDHQAGYYGEKVYRRLLDRLDQEQYDFATLLRSLFDDAAVEFDEQSIDLLHIDGLHTYEAVSNDFHTWAPKLTDDAVVIFHDTNVFDPDFGVWQLFEELSEQYLTFNFRHTHGLGVLVNHGAVEHPIGRFVAQLAADNRDARFVELLFESAGPRALAATRLEALQTDAGGNPTTLVRDLAKRDAKLAKARLRIAKQRRRIKALQDAEALARSDLRWLIRRLDDTPASPLLRRYPGFRKLKDRWVDR